MKDYQRTKDGLYAYEYPRASVTADAVLFAEKEGQVLVLLIQRGNESLGYRLLDETAFRFDSRAYAGKTYRDLSSWVLSVSTSPQGRVCCSSQNMM